MLEMPRRSLSNVVLPFKHTRPLDHSFGKSVPCMGFDLYEYVIDLFGLLLSESNNLAWIIYCLFMGESRSITRFSVWPAHRCKQGRRLTMLNYSIALKLLTLVKAWGFASSSRQFGLRLHLVTFCKATCEYSWCGHFCCCWGPISYEKKKCNYSVINQCNYNRQTKKQKAETRFQIWDHRSLLFWTFSLYFLFSWP